MGKLTARLSADSIGVLFAKARNSHVDSVKHLLACGHALIEAKKSMDHGTWQIWLMEHREELGFDDRVARMLMAGAKRQLASDLGTLTDDEAVKVSRQIWGHPPEPKVELEEHGPEYRQVMRIYEWIEKHPAFMVNSSLSRAEASELRPQLYLIGEWVRKLDQLISALPGSNGRVIGTSPEVNGNGL